MRRYVLIAAFLFYFFAFGLIVVAPLVLTDQSVARVANIQGDTVDVPLLTDLEQKGREEYIRQVCWHCHSQFVRPVNDEATRYGPVSQAGESATAFHLFGTRRIGPDLAREGGLRVDDWHLAHLFDPRSTVIDSVMPGFTWLFWEHQRADEVDELLRLLDTDGDGVVSKFDTIAFGEPVQWPEDAQQRMRSPLLDSGGVIAPRRTQSDLGTELWEGSYEAVWTGEDQPDGLISDYDRRPRPKPEALALVAYLQRLGTDIGPWREPLDVDTPMRRSPRPMRGVTVVWKDGDEEVELVVPDGEMPRRAREARLHGLAREMPLPPEATGWTSEQRAEHARARASRQKTAQDLQRQYDALMEAWRRENPYWAGRLDHGRQLYERHCAACHGDEGRGNGPAAQHLLIRPRDFTLDKYRYRSTQAGSLPLDGDLFRSIKRGLPGTAMPSWRELTDSDIWHLVDFVKHFLETVGTPEGGALGDGFAKSFNETEKTLVFTPQPARLDPQRGKAVYMAMKCYNCHGSEGLGDGPGWDGTTKDDGGRIRPRALPKKTPRDQPELRMRGGASPHDLYRVIFTGLDGVGMPSSMADFQGAWRASERVATLEEQGASEEDLQAARLAARRAMMVPLPPDAEGNLLPGVIQVEEDGRRVQYLERIERGDEWHLVAFVRWLFTQGPPHPALLPD